MQQNLGCSTSSSVARKLVTSVRKVADKTDPCQTAARGGGWAVRSRELGSSVGEHAARLQHMRACELVEKRAFASIV